MSVVGETRVDRDGGEWKAIRDEGGFVLAIPLPSERFEERHVFAFGEWITWALGQGRTR